MITENYSKRSQFYSGHVPQLLADVMTSNDWRTCLELGCGDGALVRALSANGFFKGKSAYALDASTPRMRVVASAGSEVTALVGDACNTPFEDGAMDLVITAQVIEHVGDDRAMVDEIHRVLRPQGTAYIATVFKKWYGWYFYRCNGRWTLDPTHLREYTVDGQLLDKVEARGFTILENRKSLDGRPIMDSVLRRLGASRTVYRNRLLKILRAVEVPIPGYYIWEIVCRKS